jgi:DtxR family Mn-dependent transcriptional regulator
MLIDVIEETLEGLWIRKEEHSQKSVKPADLEHKPSEDMVSEMTSKGFITVLTKTGEEEGKNVVRRHRLAERLLTDLLDVGHESLNEFACQFEHILYKGIDDKICTLLGHPKLCPHGKPIPQGPCCRTNSKTAETVISSLSDLKPGTKGKIAYLKNSDGDRLRKMMSMGVLPGTDIQLLQDFPSFLFKIGNSQFAVDEELASEIVVRRSS